MQKGKKLQSFHREAWRPEDDTRRSVTVQALAKGSVYILGLGLGFSRLRFGFVGRTLTDTRDFLLLQNQGDGRPRSFQPGRSCDTSVLNCSNSQTLSPELSLL